MLDETRIRNELRIQRILILVLLGVIVFLTFQHSHFRKKHVIEASSPMLLPPRANLPHYDKIMEILKPLEYSGIADMIKSDVDLKIDFPAGTWTVTNLHRFDDQGQIKLDHNRYGLCGELSAHVYTKIAPILEDHFDILFLRSVESGFFLRPKSTHIVILLTEKKTQERFFIDPSFQRYGREEDFSDYLFFEAADPKTHLESLKTDVTFPADSQTPLLIRKDFLICLGTELVEQKFDKDNFALVITANKRHEYSGRYVFALRRTEGKTSVFKNEPLLSQLLTLDEIDKISAKMTQWFEAASR